MARPVTRVIEVGEVFGRLTVTGFNRMVGKTRVECKCSCGKEVYAYRYNLINGNTKSCGCLRVDMGYEQVSRLANMRQVLPEGEASKRNLYSNYKCGAKKRGYSFELTLNEFEQITSSNCHYCGIEPNQLNRQRELRGAYRYNGIDRKDNSVGYTVENCVPCCGQCNRAKMDMSYADFKAWIKRLIDNNDKE